MPIGPGTKLGQYEVQAYLGQGAMGVVYSAYHPQLARKGAVKVLQAISPDADSTARFRREAQAIAQMRHPNILNVFDFGEFEGIPYMIVEFVEGGSLADRLKEGPLATSEALKFLHGIATGLDHAHSLGIVHRDVKPANVLVGKGDTPILADFGLAKLMQSSSVKSMTGTTTGTPAYMAPEQVTGSQVGPAADNYALATIAYELLTGVIPFEGEGVLELLYAHVHRQPPPPSTRKPELSKRVDDVILRGLAKDPETRWQSAEEFVTMLEAALGNQPVPAVEQTVVMGAPVPAVESAPPPEAAVPATAAAAAPVSHRRRNILLAAVGILVVLAIAAGIAVYALQSSSPTIALSSSTVAAGDKIVVTASHLPPNQVGTVTLFSAAVSFSFQADGHGNLQVEVTVPRNIDPGDHLVKLCWSGSCHAQTTLHINAASPTPSPTHSGVTQPSIHASTPDRIGQAITVTGKDFDTGLPVSIVIAQSGNTHQLSSSPVDVHSDGTFSFTGTVPSGLNAGGAEVVVCSIPGGGKRPTADQCASQPIAVER